MTIKKTAAVLGVAPSTLHRLLNAGIIPGEQLTPGAPWRIRLTDDVMARFNNDAGEGFMPMREAMRALGVSRQTVLQRVKRGELDAVHVMRGKQKGLGIVKRTGDGSLIEFRSVVDAVRCAIEVQNGMVERNAGLPPERRIEFRVGIHLGDVVEEADGDLMGDGVNIAARLEGIANPGAICLSEDAYRQVSGRLDMASQTAGVDV